MPIEVPFELAQVEIVWIESTLYAARACVITESEQAQQMSADKVVTAASRQPKITEQ